MNPRHTPKPTAPTPKPEQAAEAQKPVQTAASTAMDISGPVALEAHEPAEDLLAEFAPNLRGAARPTAAGAVAVKDFGVGEMVAVCRVAYKGLLGGGRLERGGRDYQVLAELMRCSDDCRELALSGAISPGSPEFRLSESLAGVVALIERDGAFSERAHPALFDRFCNALAQFNESSVPPAMSRRALSAREERIREAHQYHGEPGHLNVVVRDQDSEITGFGTHNRIVVLGEPDGSMIYAREDFKWWLPVATDEQRRAVMNGSARLHPKGSKLEYVGSDEPWDNGSWVSQMHNYRVVKPGRN